MANQKDAARQLFDAKAMCALIAVLLSFVGIPLNERTEDRLACLWRHVLSFPVDIQGCCPKNLRHADFPFAAEFKQSHSYWHKNSRRGIVVFVCQVLQVPFPPPNLPPKCKNDVLRDAFLPALVQHAPTQLRLDHPMFGTSAARAPHPLIANAAASVFCRGIEMQNIP